MPGSWAAGRATASSTARWSASTCLPWSSVTRRLLRSSQRRTIGSHCVLAPASRACGHLARRPSSARAVDLRERIGEELVRLVAEEDESGDLDAGIASQVFGNGVDGDAGAVGRRIAVDTHADGRERNAAGAELIGQPQA